ncbi:hypothetical protein EVAR_12505_1 [Eumeta japonica]|uniref:Uncharacterized protein n=1 Tax=Eumeta variegata TaxID=151549 RepID=A0A4C1TPN8_EUMVA|nr:hypothetical protein EVAR_12505_1 [Eumeta japonica]
MPGRLLVGDTTPTVQFDRASSTSLFLRVQVQDGRLMLPHARAASRREYDPDGPVVMAPFQGSKLEDFLKTAGDQEELSVGTLTSSSTVTAVSERDGEVVRDGRLMLPHARAPSRREYDPDGPVVMAPFQGSKLEDFPETAGDQEELSVGTSTSSSTDTAVSGSDGEVVGSRSV